jgi:hypothetical protein
VSDWELNGEGSGLTQGGRKLKRVTRKAIRESKEFSGAQREELGEDPQSLGAVVEGGEGETETPLRPVERGRKNPALVDG